VRLALCAVFLAAAACRSATAPPAPKDFRETAWGAREIDGSPAGESNRPDLTFDKKDRVSGSTGCNRFSGHAKIDGTSIRIGPLAVTRRGCPEPAMSREALFLAALEDARTFRLDWDRLVLIDSSGKQRLVLEQTERAEEKDEKPEKRDPS
jgi:heat shock protein HslJ